MSISHNKISYLPSWGVVIFHIPGVDTSRVLETLYRKYNVGCAVMGSNIRFSPHFYNTLEDIDKAVFAVAQVSSALRS